MLLYERLEKVLGKLQSLEENYLDTEEDTEEENVWEEVLNDLEKYIEKIEDILD